MDTFDFILFLSQQPLLLMKINQTMENTESIYILWIELVLILVAAVVCKGVLIFQIPRGSALLAATHFPDDFITSSNPRSQ